MNLHDKNDIKQLSDYQFLRPDSAGRDLVFNVNAKHINEY
jgi:hypothetical protein